MSDRKLDADVIVENELLILALKVRETLKDPDKWCQYTRHNEMGQFCLVGHVEEALGVEWWTLPLSKSEPCIIKAKLLFDQMGVYDDIDTPLNTAVNHNNTHNHKEVLALFDKGIENLKQGMR